MATTKASEKRSAKSKAAPATPAVDPWNALADELLVTQIHRVLVRLGEPARISEILREIDDESVGVGLARHTLESHPRRFLAIDRRWDVAQRYFDKQRPVVRMLEEIISLYGAAMPSDDIPGELAHVYGRVREHFIDVAPRMLRGSQFFSIKNGLAYGLTSWLLNLDGSTDADLLFYNYLAPDALAPVGKFVSRPLWENDPIQTASDILALTPSVPVDNRLLQLLAYKSLGTDFDPIALFAAFASSDRLLAISGHRWISRDALETIREKWRALSAQVWEQAPDEPAAIAVPEAPALPLQITEDDATELRRYFADRSEIVTTDELLTNVLEIRPGSRTFEEDRVTLGEFLRAHPDDFVWVGTDRFRAPDTLPGYLGQVPESLRFPVLPRFETADGEILDQLIADAGFDEGLLEEVLDPIAQDVNDQEDAKDTRWPEGISASSSSLRLVLKAHHKEIGTFPLAQIPPGFLPAGPAIVEVTLRSADGLEAEIYIDYNVQIIYGLFDFYENIVAESGAVFHISKTDRPDVYEFRHDNETDHSAFINPQRMQELLDYRTELENASIVSTYDIVRQILDHYRKGCSFNTLLTEVNVIRRTPRRLLASILSGYAAFHPRANRWTFDPKRETEGFERQKTPYLIKK